MGGHLLCLAAICFAACRYPHQFKAPPLKVPHAVLQETTYPHAGHIFVTHINDQPISFWHSGRILRVPVGTNSCRTAYTDREETLSYAPMQVTLVAGRTYVLSRVRNPDHSFPTSSRPHPVTANAWIIHDNRDQAAIHETHADGTRVLVTTSPKEDYVFGASSGDAAIAGYKRKN
jgi:hypothetical protein